MKKNSLYFIQIITLLLIICNTKVQGQTKRSYKQSQLDIESHLIAYYKLDGNAIDSFGNNDGTVENAASVQGVGKADNSALYFNGGVTDVVRLPNTLLHQREVFSICAWVNSDNTGANPYFVSASDNGGNRLLLGIRNTYVNDLYVVATPLWADKMTSGQWHHLCFTYDSPNTVTEYYLDGKLSGRLSITAPYTMNVLPGGITIGQDQDTLGGGFAASDAFKGKLQHLRFYDKQVFANQVYSMYIQDRGACTDACTTCNNNGECTACKGNRLLKDGYCLCPQDTIEDFNSTNCTDMLSEANDGLVAYYPMHNNATDIIGGNHGTIFDLKPGYDRHGYPAQGLDFPYKLTSYYRIPHNLINGKTQFAVSCWIYHRGGSSFILSGSRTGGNDLILFFGGAYLYGSHYSWGTVNLAERTQNRWVHFTYSIGTTQAKAYIDGDLIHTKSKSSTAFVIGTNGLLIGQDQDTLGGGFEIGSTMNAILTDYKIYNKEINEDQARKMYQIQAENCPFYCETCLPNTQLCGSCKGNRVLVQGQCVCNQGQVDDDQSLNCFDIDTQQKDGLQAYYPLHNNVNDVINGHDGTAHSVTPVPNRFGVENSAYNFVVGTNTYITIPPASYNGNNEVSFAMWMKQTQIDNDHRFIISSATTSNYNYLLIGLNHGDGILSDGTAYYYLQKALNKDVWYHIIFSLDDKFRIYLNGKLYFTKSRTQSVLNAGNCYIGQEQDSYGGSFAANQAIVAHISDIRVYDHGLLDNEAFMLYYSEQYICEFQCTTCLRESDQCSTCRGDRYLQSGDCLCPDTKYDDFNSTNCPNCAYQCGNCVGTADCCLTCSDENRTVSNTVSCSCNDGWFDQGSSNPVCGKCVNKCKTCVDTASKCTECQGQNRNNDHPNCTCPFGRWDNGTDCLLCDEQCNGCTGAANECDACTDSEKTLESKCLQCKGDKTLDGSNNCVCAVTGEFELAGNDNCQNCDYKCETCITSADNCQTCSDSNRSTSNTVKCSCNNGWFEDGVNNKICGQCSPFCVTCVNSASNCTQCQGAQRQNDFPTCTCNHGYYHDPIKADCQQCDSQCDGCTGAADECDACSDSEKTLNSKCLLCKGDKTLDGSNNCVCTVSGEFELAGNDNCQQCDFQCETCVTSSDNCQTCSDDNRSTSNTINCSCNDGWFQNGSNIKQCGKCSPFCATCVNSASNCTLCQGVQRKSDFPTCTCNHGYYHDPTQADCQQCDSQCDGCTGAANECDACSDSEKTLDSKCLQCKGDKTLDGSNNCVCAVTGEFELAGNDNCQQCDFQCETCVTSSDNCQTCSDDNRSTSNTINCFCNDGWFQNGSNVKQCAKCQHNCLTCQDTLEKCVECKGNFRNDNAPVCDCVSNYFDDNVNSDCQKCADKCSECQGQSDTCTECSHINRDIERNCECGQGYFGDCSTKCQNNCLECTGTFDNCTECQGLYRKSDNKPECQCIEGYYDNGSQADCLQCQVSNCKVCDPSNPQKCLEANDGYFLNDDLILNTQKCKFDCLTCDKQGCIDCVQSNQPSRLLEQQCSCPDKFYSDNLNTQCQECLPECQTCNNGVECIIMEYCQVQCSLCQKSSTNCLICQGLHRESPPSCLCKKGYYQDGQEINCQKCAPQCEECDSFGQCTKCLNQQFEGPDCIEKYVGNQFEIAFENQGNSNNIIYGVCDIQCSACQSRSDNCTQCAVGIKRTQQIPTCQCQEGYHDNQGSYIDCQKCPSECKTCINHFQCKSCHSNQNKVLNQYTNKCECSQGYTFKTGTLDCIECYTYQEKCYIQCPQQTYPDEIKKICIEVTKQYSQNSSTLYTVLLSIVLVQILTFYVVKKCTQSRFNNKLFQKVQNKDHQEDLEARKIKINNKQKENGSTENEIIVNKSDNSSL